MKVYESKKGVWEAGMPVEFCQFLKTNEGWKKNIWLQSEQTNFAFPRSWRGNFHASKVLFKIVGTEWTLTIKKWL